MERQSSAAVIAVTLIGSMIGACDTRPETDTRYSVATSVKGVPGELLLNRVLVGHANADGTACFWVNVGSDRRALVWPSGSLARPSPLAVYDQKGARMAAVGQVLTIVGARDDPTSNTVRGCNGFTQAWIVTGLLRPGEGSTYPVATTGCSHSCLSLAALLEGMLCGQVNSDGTACLWIGERATGIALIWPGGFTVRGSPLTVYDGSGFPVAVVEWPVQLGGGLLPPEFVGAVFGCSGFSEAWIAGAVVPN